MLKACKMASAVKIRAIQARSSIRISCMWSFHVRLFDKITTRTLCSVTSEIGVLANFKQSEGREFDQNSRRLSREYHQFCFGSNKLVYDWIDNSILASIFCCNRSLHLCFSLERKCHIICMHNSSKKVFRKRSLT